VNLTNPRTGARKPATEPIRCFALHPDGRRVFLGSSGAAIAIWDIDVQRSAGTLEHEAATGELLSLAFDPRGRSLGAVLSSGLAFFDLEDGITVHAPLNSAVSGAEIRFTEGGAGRALVIAGGDLEVWSLSSCTLLRRLSGGSGDVRWAALSARGDRVLAVDAADVLRVWDVETGERLRMWSRAGQKDASARLLGAAFHPDGRRVLSTTLADTVLWDAERGERLWLVSGPSPTVNSAVFHSDGKRALMTGHNGSVELWDIEAGRLVRAFRETRGKGGLFAFCPDGKRIVCRSEDGRSWLAIEIETGASVTSMRTHSSPLRTLLPHPDGARLITAGEDEPIMVWTLETGAPTAMLGRSRDSGAIGGGPVAVSPAGARALSAHEDGAVNLWDTKLGTCVRVPLGGERVHNMAFHPDERHALFAIGNGIEIWDLEMMYRVDALELKSRVSTIVCAGHRIYAASLDFRLRVWDVSAGRCVLAIDAESPGTRPALNAFLKWLAFTELVGGADLAPRVKVLTIEGGDVLSQLSWETFREIYLVALDNGGKLAVVAGGDAAHIWDIPGDAWGHSIQVPERYLIQAAIEPLGRWALLTHRRGIAVWDLASGELTEEWLAEGEVTETAIGGGGMIVVATSDGGVSLLRMGGSEVTLIQERIESLRKSLAYIAEKFRNPRGANAFPDWTDDGWEDYSEAKGNLRWTEAYLAAVNGLEPSSFDAVEDVLARLFELVDEVDVGAEHPAPDDARRRVRKALEKYRAT
jgi:WD40 repeat protein